MYAIIPLSCKHCRDEKNQNNTVKPLNKDFIDDILQNEWETMYFKNLI